MPVEHNEFRSVAHGVANDAGGRVDTRHEPQGGGAIAVLSGRPLLPNTGIPINLDWVREVRANTSAVERRTQSHVARPTVKKDWQAPPLPPPITIIILTTLSRPLTYHPVS